MGWEWRCFFPLKWIQDSSEFCAHLKKLQLDVGNLSENTASSGRTDVYRVLRSFPDSVGLKKRGNKSNWEVKLRTSVFPECKGLEEWEKYIIKDKDALDNLLKEKGFLSKQQQGGEITNLESLGIAKVRKTCTLSKCALIFDQLRLSDYNKDNTNVISHDWCSISIESSSKCKVIHALEQSEIIAFISPCEDANIGGYPTFVHNMLEIV